MKKKPSTDPSSATAFMEGFPPQKDKIIRFADRSFMQYPQMRWSMNHMQELAPSKSVWRGAGAHRPFAYTPLEVENINIESADGTSLSWEEALLETHTDGLLVLHRGNLVYERYLAYSDENARHIWASCTKSIVGTLALELIYDGILDADALIPKYIPELADSAWGNATVRHVMDMLVSMTFYEDYTDPNSDVYRYLASAGMLPAREFDPKSFYDYLPTVTPDAEHDRVFAYREPNINVLGWLVRRVTGTALSKLVTDKIWQHIGTEHDAYFMLDSSGAETMISSTLRDFTRFGELIRNHGRVGDKQLIRADIFPDIFRGGDQSKFAAAKIGAMEGWSYRAQWWMRHHENRICAVARGAYGQFLYIDPTSEIVIARFGSANVSPTHLLDRIVFPTFDAVIDHLR